jgi:hypothetical protein
LVKGRREHLPDSALGEGDSPQERRLAALKAKLSHIARIESAQGQLSRKVEAMRQEAKPDIGHLRSEISQLKKAPMLQSVLLRTVRSSLWRKWSN